MEKLLQELNANIKFSNQLSYQILMSNIISNLDIDKKDKEILLLLLQARDRNYIRINNNEQCYQNIINYLNLIRPLELPLCDLLRIGGNGDGGYVMYNGGGGILNFEYFIFTNIKSLFTNNIRSFANSTKRVCNA
ncbi:hypothetical protein HpCK101_07360 [Helicobacter pylori]